MITQETQAAAVANSIIALVQQAATMRAAIDAAATQWTELGAAAKLNAFPTSAMTDTGGQTAADVPPNPNNPILVTAGAGQLLTRAVSANVLASMLTYLQGLSLAIEGIGIGPNGAAAQLLALAL
jgi:hypothetical protein